MRAGLEKKRPLSRSGRINRQELGSTGGFGREGIPLMVMKVRRARFVIQKSSLPVVLQF